MLRHPWFAVVVLLSYIILCCAVAIGLCMLKTLTPFTLEVKVDEGGCGVSRKMDFFCAFS